MSNIVNNFQKILETILPIYQQINIPKKPGRKPKMTDIEVVALSLTAEYMSIDSENALFKQLKDAPIDNLIERSQFNVQRTPSEKTKKSVLPCRRNQKRIKPTFCRK